MLLVAIRRLHTKSAVGKVAGPVKQLVVVVARDRVEAQSLPVFARSVRQLQQRAARQLVEPKACTTQKKQNAPLFVSTPFLRLSRAWFGKLIIFMY